MCLAVPGRVISVNGPVAHVDFGGVQRSVQVALVPDLQVGQYVLVHAGFAIQRLEMDEASPLISILDEASALVNK
jgi:hydrogenase expression/formation protein HypC